jgi:DNA-binding LacI/PurR family transcriptional regulator
MSRRRPRAQELALKIGVSPSTVSRALSPTQRHRISAPVRERIETLAREMGYVPDAAGRSLREGRAGVVGFYSGYGFHTADEFSATMVFGSQEALAERGYSLMLCGSPNTGEHEQAAARLADGRIDGMLVHAPPDDPLPLRLAELGIPQVGICDAPGLLPRVVVDDALGSHLVLERLAARGCRRIAFVRSPLVIPSVTRREIAYLAFCTAHKQQPCVLTVSPMGAAEFLSRKPPGVDGVFCWNDMFAYALLEACHHRGIIVPELLAVAGFDGFPNAKNASFTLTTVGPNWPDVASTAVAALDTLLRGQSLAQPVTAMPVRLIEGHSA